MNQQRELIHLACRLPESEQATALDFLRALKAQNSPVVKKLQQQQQLQTSHLKRQLLTEPRQNNLLMVAQAYSLARYFADRIDADLMLEGALSA